MVNPDLKAAPRFELSPDLVLHWYEPGDEDCWREIHELADEHNRITAELFADQFTHDSFKLSERQCYLLDRDSRPVATGTAWGELEGPFAGFGRPHWIAVIPPCQGRGIGKMLMSIICQRLLALGHPRAYLTTSPLRPAAIHLYQKFGFTRI
jgi:GNAT superfamily N-acetyltransferase